MSDAPAPRPGPVSPVGWVLRRHAWLLLAVLTIMAAAPYLGSLPVRTIPAVVALVAVTDAPASHPPSAELDALLGGHASDLSWVLGLLVGAGALSFFLALANTRMGARLSSACARDLRARIHEILLARPPAYLQTYSRGNHVQNALINQARAVASYAANTVPASLGVFFAVLIWAQTLYASVAVTGRDVVAVTLVGGVIGVLIAVNLTTVWLAGKKSQVSQRQVMNEQTAFIGLAGESVEHLEALQLELAEPAQMRRLHQVLARMSAAEVRVAIWSGLSSAASGGVVLLGIPLLVIAWQALFLPSAQLAVMIPALMMLQRSVAGIGSLWTSYKVTQPAIELVAELLSPEPALWPEARSRSLPQPETVRAIGAALSFRGVHWAAQQPDGQTRAVLAGVDLDLAPGEIVALVGAGGCGKSTLLRAALGILRPDQGTVHLDGVDIATMDVRELRARVGILAQHPAFFARTVRENLVLDDRQVDDQAIGDAAEVTQFAEVLARLPAGLDEKLAPGGGTLSGSEKRRLALTRLLLRAPQVILIDELEAGLPQAQAQDILAAVRRATRGTTCLLVTHRPDLLAADRVAFVDNGCIVALGTHEQLQAQSEAYRSLLARNRDQSS